MASNGSQTEDFLKGPLYVYDLPRKLLANLTLKTNAQPIDTSTPENITSVATESSERDSSAVPTSTSCALCQTSFLNVQEHRDHARSDHHRYNVKAQLRGNRLLSESEFTKAIGEIDESISGSESSDSDSDEFESHPSDSNLVALLKKQARIAQETDTETTREKSAFDRQPIIWFSSPDLPSQTAVGVYKALFSNEEQDEPEHVVNCLQRKQLEPIKRVNHADKTFANYGPHIFMCMLGGGHFAAMIIALAPEIQKRPNGIEERQAKVLAHKTFHRYTTRRKQGGSQSANDSAKGAAHSAGSSLRRYNEAALETDIRTLLGEWKAMIDSAQLIFVRATGSTNRRTLFGSYEGQVLRNNDPRIRGFPFTTRRATQAELMRCFKELTRAKVSQIDEAALAVADQSKQREKSAKPSKASPQPKTPKLSMEEEAELLHTSQIQALIRRSKAPALLSYISNNSISPSFRFFPPDAAQNYHAPTPLHLAANSESPALVNSLLIKAHFDPTVTNAEGKTPFDLAGDRATRDAFRVARYEMGESAWDWEAAHVLSPVSRAEVSQRQGQQKEEAAKEEANRRKAEIERLKAEDAANAAAVEKRKNAGGKKLSSLDKTAAEKREDEMRGMTPEMRTRLERERRARAAEERIRRMQRG